MAQSAAMSPAVGVHADLLPAPPQLTPQQLARLEEAQQKMNGPAPPLPQGDAPPAAPSVPETAPNTSAGAAGVPAGPRLPGDFRFFRNQDLGAGKPSGFSSSTNEPSSDNTDEAVFYTGNWYAALSADAGQTFSFVNPFTTFPASDGGFCCDQVVMYDASRDSMFWTLQYVASATGNRHRLAVARNKSDLLAGVWCYYDFTPQQLGLPSGRWFDYPRLALSNNFLYVTSNIFTPGNPFATEASIMRLPLTELGNCAGFGFSFYVANDRFTFAPTQGATTTMYWGAHNSLSSLRIYRWAESSGTIFWDDRGVSTWPNPATFNCPGPDGRNFCGFSDGRILGMWVANGQIGFMWNAGQGGGFPYPYVHVAIFRESDRALLSQPILWSSVVAWQYPAIGVNSRGHVAGPVFYGGGSYYPSAAVIIWDDLSPVPAPWENYFVVASTAGPLSNRWGDYVASRRFDSNPTTWNGTAYSLQGGGGNSNARPRFLWFGRERDQSPSNDYLATGVAIASLPFAHSLNTVNAGTSDNDPAASCVPGYSNSVWYRYTPPKNQAVSINSFGSNYDTVLGVYTGTKGALTQVACNDDYGGLQSRVDIALSGGVTYRILVGDYGSPGGGNLSFNMNFQVPSNDSFASATLVGPLPYTDTVNTVKATNEPNDPVISCKSSYGHSVWYRYTPASGQVVNIDTFGSNYDTVLAVYTGTKGALTQVACNDDTGGLQSRAQVSLTGGVTYHILVGAWISTNGGNLSLNVGQKPTPTPTATPTNTPTAIDTPTSTPTPTDTPTPTATPTSTPTATDTPTSTPTPTATSTATPTITSTPTITPTPTITSTPTVTSTPTKQPDPGDTDGDGCSDVRENGPDPRQGGLRNYLNPWDFFDFNGDRNIDAPNDILQVMMRYSANPVLPYDARADRGPPVPGAQYAWQRTGPDGVIDAPNDILSVKFQYQHDCRT